jgi:Protein of unknown function (DUF2911)
LKKGALKKMRRIAAALAVVALAAPAFAQQPRAPRETVKASVGGKTVSVEYGRPSLKGRSFDELIKQLPDDRIWRAGVDQVTTLTTETALSVGGKKVPAGKYSVYVHAPESGDYSFVLNKDLGVPLKEIFAAAPPNLANEPWPHIDDYTKAVGDKEVARAGMKKLDVKAPADLFTITAAPAGKGTTLTFTWGDRSWAVELQPGS